MTDHNNDSPGPGAMFRKIAQTGLGLLHNRGELLVVEFQQEKERAVELLVWIIALVFLAIMAAVLLTGTIIFLFPEEYRIYAVGGFTLLYLIGAIRTGFMIRSLLKRAPFSETVSQIQKDREWLESFK